MTHTMTAYAIDSALWRVDAYENSWEAHNKLTAMWAHAITPGTDLFRVLNPVFALKKAFPDFGTGAYMGDLCDETLIKHLPVDEDVVIYSLCTKPNARSMYQHATIEILHKRPGAASLEVLQSRSFEDWSAEVMTEACDEDEIPEIVLHNVRVAPHEFVTVHRDHLEAFEAAAKFHKQPELAEQFAKLARLHAPAAPAAPGL